DQTNNLTTDTTSHSNTDQTNNLTTDTTSHSNTDQNIINKINNSISTASFYLVDNNELNEYVFLRNNVNYTIILNAPKNSDNLMVANHILDTKKKTEYTYSYLNGSASTSGFGYINATDDELFPLSGNNNGYYKVSDGKDEVLAENNFSNYGNDVRVTEDILVNNSGYIVHKVSFKNISSFKLGQRKYYALLDTMLNDNDYIPIYKDNYSGAFISNTDMLLYTNIISQGNSYALNWGERYTQDSDVQINNNSTYKKPFVFNHLLKQNVSVLKDNVDTAIRYVTPSVSLSPQESIDIIFTESVFSKKEIENIKKNDGNTEFLNYFYKTFEENYSPLKQDNNNNLIIGTAENINQFGTVIENAKKSIEQAYEVESNIINGKYLNNSKLNIAIKDTINDIKPKKELIKMGKFTGAELVDDSIEFFKSIGMKSEENPIKWKDLETVKKIGHTANVINNAATLITDGQELYEIYQGKSTDQKEYIKEKEVIKSKKYKNNKSDLSYDATEYSLTHLIFSSLFNFLANAGSIITRWVSALFVGPLGVLAGIALGIITSLGIVALGKWLWEKWFKKSTIKSIIKKK
ncbi:hypothetical protein D9N16_11345, partial [Lactococcus raffinolactis]|uniref:hypothetical protein n=1 Tax=Pseudolactococcus raffinolactis TaxID=1366 RepID=UPI001C70375A